MKLRDIFGIEGAFREFRIWRKDVHQRKIENARSQRAEAELQMRLLSGIAGLPPKSFIKTYDKSLKKVNSRKSKN
ncbi:hypothetical protein J4212_06230 [Candidatus Woesearchaeota archaeon]|nr:hypothetical protein [Candidatus Woesearchaeota archaeon]